MRCDGPDMDVMIFLERVQWLWFYLGNLCRVNKVLRCCVVQRDVSLMEAEEVSIERCDDVFASRRPVIVEAQSFLRYINLTGWRYNISTAEWRSGSAPGS
jgi:hypothetical protein